MSIRPIPETRPHVFPLLRHREYAYVIVREPDCFVLFKAYTNNVGTVRLLEFPDLKKALAFVATLPAARVVIL